MASKGSWVVLKFGGTSVSTFANWRNIAAVVRDRLTAGGRVLVVHSALSGITDRLEKLLAAALAGAHEPMLAAIEERHRTLAAELDVGVSAELQRHFTELRQVASGLALLRELSDRTRARVMATGELMATEIGARFLQAQGIGHQWTPAGACAPRNAAAPRPAPTTCPRPAISASMRRCRPRWRRWRRW
jgi:diaminopimelate decarboxylase/aspartate kinase